MRDATTPSSRSVPLLPSPKVSTRRWQRVYRVAVLGCDGIAAVFAVEMAERLRSNPLPEFVVGSTVRYTLLSLLAIPMWVALVLLCGAHRWRHVHTAAAETARVINAAMSMLAVVAMLNLAWKLEISRAYVAVGVSSVLGVTIVLRVIARLVVHVLRRFGRCQERVVLVGQASAVDDIESHLSAPKRHGYLVVARLVSGPEVLDRPAATSDEIEPVVAAIDESGASLVVVAGPNAFSPGGARLLLARLALQAAGGGGGEHRRNRPRRASSRVEVVFAPEVTELSSPGAVVRSVSDLLFLEVPARTGFGYVAAKRALDIVASVIGLVVFSPLVGLLMVLIRADSPGPALFRQARVGRNGRTFRVVKFRSMAIDAEEQLRRKGLYEEYVANDFKLSPERDPRITRIGRFLRRTSLDELPQLWNVLRGEMSLVGPRPVVIDELARYGSRAPAYLALRPGLTGYWQVNGRSNVAFPERAELDEYYFENRTMRLDLLILARTIVRVVQGDGAH